MALLALGSIVVAADGGVTKSGECEVLYDLLLADTVALAAAAGVPFPSGADSAKGKAAIGKLATTIATYVRTALTVRAKARVTNADAGLQKTPDPNNANTATLAPAGNVDLSIV